MSLSATALNHATGGGTSTSVTVTSTAANAVLVLAVTICDSVSLSVSSVTDTAGLTWTRRSQQINNNSAGLGTAAYQAMEVWWAQAPSIVTSNTITANFSSSYTSALFVLEVDGVPSPSAPWDGNSALPAMAANLTGTASNPSVGGVSTNSSSGLLLWFGHTQQGGTIPVPTGWSSSGAINNEPAHGSLRAYETIGWSAYSSAEASATITDPSGTSQEYWGVIVDAISATPPYPSGTLSTTEASDVLTATGWSVSSGITGYVSALEGDDIFAASGAPAATGTLATTEAPDIFSAYGYEPVIGQWISTENADTFSATGFGVGISGSWSSTEASDTVEISGYSPVSGQWVSIEAADIFVATAAGVVVTRNQIMFFVT